MLIDAHIHLDQYREDEVPKILEEAQLVIAVSTDLQSCKKTLTLSQLFPNVKAAYGFHPEQSLPSDHDKQALFNWIRLHAEEMVAIGEVGLPYYRKQAQLLDERPYIELLDQFIQLAKELHKPIVLHAVYEDALVACDLLERHGVTRAHFHWFKGSEEAIERMIHNGYYISITPDCVYEAEIQALIKSYPLELMMVETDGPWPFEGPFEKVRTSPFMMAKTIDVIASLKGITVQEAAKIVTRNTEIFYDL